MGALEEEKKDCGKPVDKKGRQLGEAEMLGYAFDRLDNALKALSDVWGRSEDILYSNISDRTLSFLAGTAYRFVSSDWGRKNSVEPTFPIVASGWGRGKLVLTREIG